MNKRKSNLSVLRDLLTIACNRTDLVYYMGFTHHAPTRGWREGWHAEKAAQDVWKLKMLNAFDDGVHTRLNDNFALAQRIKACAENGKVVAVESGRDCDCVRYAGVCHEIDANLAAYEMLYKRTADSSDGVFGFQIVSPSEAEKIEYRSRDLAMEAYENGHPHVIYDRAP